eukprot:scpid48793/ scgid35347/ Kinesin-like protein KIF22; Chromokinesin kid
MPEESVSAIVRLRPKVSSSPTLDIRCEPQAITIARAGCTEQRSYSFTAVYNEGTDHESLYSEQLSRLVTHPLCGVNATVFAYGHTGAGKTHTMLGTDADPGMIPRSVRALLNMAAYHSGQGERVQVVMSYLEVYNEKIFDLLVPRTAKPNDLPIRQDRQYNISVAGLTEVPLTSYEAFQAAFGPASEKRTTASTKLNSESSRSHAILLLKVKRQQGDRQLTGKLHLIDLAGSENAKRAGNVGDRLKESGAINTSLFALSQVVNALTSTKGNLHIPYRDSKLTRLLQDSLGGSAKSLVIANIAPEESHLVDTVSTLQFATKSMQIINKPVSNEKQVGGVAASAPGTQANAGPTVAPKLDVLPSPFVRHTKALLSDEVRSMNSLLREEVMRDQKEMQNVINRLTETVAYLASQQGPTGQPVNPSSSVAQQIADSVAVAAAASSSSSSANAPAVTASSSSVQLQQRRALHSPCAAPSDLAPSSAATTVDDFDGDFASKGDGFNDDFVSSGQQQQQPSTSVDMPVSVGHTFVVDRHRSADSVPFSQLAEPSAMAASPLLPVVCQRRRYRQSCANTTSALSTASSSRSDKPPAMPSLEQARVGTGFRDYDDDDFESEPPARHPRAAVAPGNPRRTAAPSASVQPPARSGKVSARARSNVNRRDTVNSRRRGPPTTTVATVTNDVASASGHPRIKEPSDAVAASRPKDLQAVVSNSSTASHVTAAKQRPALSAAHATRRSPRSPTLHPRPALPSHAVDLTREDVPKATCERSHGRVQATAAVVTAEAAQEQAARRQPTTAGSHCNRAGDRADVSRSTAAISAAVTIKNTDGSCAERSMISSTATKSAQVSPPERDSSDKENLLEEKEKKAIGKRRRSVVSRHNAKRRSVGGERLREARLQATEASTEVPLALPTLPPPGPSEQQDDEEVVQPRRRRNKRKSAGPPVDALVWENDLADVSTSMSVTSQSAMTEPDMSLTEEAAPPQRKKKKRLISRKAMSQNVVDQSPSASSGLQASAPNVTRSILGDSNVLNSAMSIPYPGDSQSKGFSCVVPQNSATTSASLPVSTSGNDGAGSSHSFCSSVTLAPRRPLSASVTPVAKVSPMPISDTPELFDSSPACASGGSLSDMISPSEDTMPAADHKPFSDTGKNTSVKATAAASSSSSSWSPEEDEAFREAQALYPTGQRFVSVTTDDGQTKKVGRNILISAYIAKKTGKERTAAQVGRRCRAIAQRKEKDNGDTPQTRAELKARIKFLEKIAKEAELVFQSRVKELVQEYSVALGNPGTALPTA